MHPKSKVSEQRKENYKTYLSNKLELLAWGLMERDDQKGSTGVRL